jgi:uncharacterized protein
MPSSLIERILYDIKTSLKANNSLRVSVMRLLLAAVRNKEIAVKRPLEDADVLDIVASQIKLRHEAVEGFRTAGRAESAAKEEQEMILLQELMPPPLAENDVRAIVERAVAETRAASPKDMGKVMALVMPQVKGRADGALISRLVKEKLSSH